MAGIHLRSQCCAVAKPGLSPSSKASVYPPPCPPSAPVSTLTPGVGGWWDRARCTSRPHAASLRLLPAVAARQSLGRPSQEASLKALLAPPQFQEEEGPLDRGRPRAAIPEHPRVPGRPTAHQSSGRAGEDSGPRVGAQVPGVAQGGQGSRPGGWAGAGVSPQPVPGAPWHFMEGEAAGQVGGWGAGGSLLQGSPQR